MLIEDRILELMINEKEPLFIGEIVAVLEIHRFFVNHSLKKLIKNKVVFYNQKNRMYSVL